MNLYKLSVLCFSLCLLFPSVVMSQTKQPTTVLHVDLERYLGKWYEIAKLPNFFQDKCLTSEADYSLLSSNQINIINTCQTASGEIISANGIGTVVNTETNAELTVVFDNWISKILPWLTRGDYWIIDLDENYQWVIVGHPKRKYLWILSRNPKMDEDTYKLLLNKTMDHGYDASRIIRSRN